MQTAQFIIELLKAVFLGIVEGITEWLPISSTGHLILVNEFLNLRQSKDFIDMFNIVIQLGAILAVMVIYFNRLNPFQPGKAAREVIACIPSAFFGLLLDDWMEAHLSNFFVVAIMLVVYGIAFIWIEDRNRRVEPKVTDLARMSYKTAFYIGLFQVLSIIPGTSRSGATILGGIIVGTSRSVAADFTFFLGIPTMFGYSGLKAVKYFIDGNTLTGGQVAILLVASVTAFVVSLFVIRFLMNYIKKHDFTVFGKYRIVLGIIVLLYGAVKLIFG